MKLVGSGDCDALDVPEAVAIVGVLLALGVGINVETFVDGAVVLGTMFRELLDWLMGSTDSARTTENCAPVLVNPVN